MKKAFAALLVSLALAASASAAIPNLERDHHGAPSHAASYTRGSERGSWRRSSWRGTAATGADTNGSPETRAGSRRSARAASLHTGIPPVSRGNRRGTCRESLSSPAASCNMPEVCRSAPGRLSPRAQPFPHRVSRRPGTPHIRAPGRSRTSGLRAVPVYETGSRFRRVRGREPGAGFAPASLSPCKGEPLASRAPRRKGEWVGVVLISGPGHSLITKQEGIAPGVLDCYGRDELDSPRSPRFLNHPARGCNPGLFGWPGINDTPVIPPESTPRFPGVQAAIIAMTGTTGLTWGRRKAESHQARCNSRLEPILRAFYLASAPGPLCHTFSGANLDLPLGHAGVLAPRDLLCRLPTSCAGASSSAKPGLDDYV